MDRDIPSFNHLVVEKIQHKNMQIHYQKLHRIKNCRSHKANGSCIPPSKLKTKKYQIEEERKTQIEKNNMRLFSKMAKILRRDDPNNKPSLSGVKLNSRMEREYSRINQENKTMLERLCHLKPTINNKKMQFQRQQELKYLRFLGKHSSHHLPPAGHPHEHTNSFRTSHPSQVHKANRVKTETFKVTRGDFAMEGEFALNPRPKLTTEGQDEVRPATQGDSKRLRYSSSSQEEGKRAGSEWFATGNEEEGGHRFKDIELFKTMRELRGRVYSFLLVRRYSCYQMLCCGVDHPEEEYLLQLGEGEGNAILEALNYDYNRLVELLQIRRGQLVVGEEGRQEWQAVRKTTNAAPAFLKSHLSNITELNEEESKLKEQLSRINFPRRQQQQG